MSTGETIEQFRQRVRDLLQSGELGRSLHRATAEVGMRSVEISQRNYLRGPRPEKLGRVSGALARSLRWKTQPTGESINLILTAGGGPEGVWYADMHEFGLHGMRARPFLRPAAKKASKEAPRIFTSEVVRTLKRGLGGR